MAIAFEIPLRRPNPKRRQIGEQVTLVTTATSLLASGVDRLLAIQTEFDYIYVAINFIGAVTNLLILFFLKKGVSEKTATLYTRAIFLVSGFICFFDGMDNLMMGKKSLPYALMLVGLLNIILGIRLPSRIRFIRLDDRGLVIKKRPFWQHRINWEHLLDIQIKMENIVFHSEKKMILLNRNLIDDAEFRQLVDKLNDLKLQYNFKLSITGVGS